MTDLPLEIIDCIMTFVDAPSLYELGHVSHVLRFLSKKHLHNNHIKHASIRLWMHQPGTMSHTPIDFDYQSSQLSASSNTMASFCFNNQPIRFDPKKPIFMDGCTIIIHPNPLQPSRKNYGITYQQPTLMEAAAPLWNVKRQGQWFMQGELEQDGLLKPIKLVCDSSLFNPDTLDIVLRQQTIRLQERIQQKKLNHRGSLPIAALASPTKESCSAKASGILPSNSSFFTSISS